MAKTVVPFRRPLKLGSRGSDVVAVKRALHKLNSYYHVKGSPWTPVYGPFLKVQMRRWQKKHMQTPGDGSYGQRTHAAFVRRNAFDAYGAWLMKSAEWQTPEEKKRDCIVRTAIYSSAQRSQIGYTQGPARWSGIDRRIKPPNVPPLADCSSLSTWCYWVADQEIGGVPDPNGLNWRSGFTGTMKMHGRKVTNPKPGDLALYGPGTGKHVTVYIGGGKCVSHGTSSGPLVLPVRYRSDLTEFRDYLGGI